MANNEREEDIEIINENIDYIVLTHILNIQTSRQEKCSGPSKKESMSAVTDSNRSSRAIPIFPSDRRKNRQNNNFQKSFHLKDIASSSSLNNIRDSKEKENFIIIDESNEKKIDETLITNCLKKHFLLQHLNDKARSSIVKQMARVKVLAGTKVFEKGESGEYLYILQKGEALVTENNDQILLQIGECIGELALLHNAPRSGTVDAITDCFFWVLQRNKFKKIVDEINNDNYEENKKYIESVSIFKNSDQKDALINFLMKETFNKGKYIVKKGDQADCIYLIKEGIVECKNQYGKVIKTLESGDTFGERALLVGTKRTMDVVAKTDCTCYAIAKKDLNEVMCNRFKYFLFLNLFKEALRKSKFFNKVYNEEIDLMFQKFHGVNLGKNNVAYIQGHVKSSQFIVVIDGNLINSKTKEKVASRGDILFEEDVFSLSSSKTNYALYPEPDVLLLEADTQEILNHLQIKSFNELAIQDDFLDQLFNISLFKSLPILNLKKIAKKIQIIKYKNGDKIIAEGENADKFYIVKSGNIEIRKNNVFLRLLNPKEFFGERGLLESVKRTASCYAKGDTEVYSLNKLDFSALLEDNMKEFLKKRLYLQDDSIKLEDLIFIREIGRGNYGNVCLVASRKDKKKYKYAIKSINSIQIHRENLYDNLILEKNILLQVDHPFIVKLVKCLKDENNVYFLMEYLEGKELFDVIRDIGLVDIPVTQFFSASMFLAINYLHNKHHVIYRDIKPENIIVQYDGYIKLVDFGTAKIIKDRTSTILGTPHYMAPEVILGKLYSFEIDYWSIAICMYEFICGGVPFGERANDVFGIYKEIIIGKLEFPNNVDRNFKNLMRRMLNVDLSHRCVNFEAIRNHAFFKGFNWDELSDLKMKAPYLPQRDDSQEDITKSDENTINYVDYIKDFTEKLTMGEHCKSKLREDEYKKFNKWANDF